MKIIAIVTAVVICRALIHEFGELVDDVIPDSHKGAGDGKDGENM